MKKLIIFLWFISSAYCQALAQNNLYVSGSGIGGYVLGQFNVETCEWCTEFFIPNSEGVSGGMADVVAMPDGQVVVIWHYDEIYIYDPPSSTPVSTFNPPGNINFGGGVLAPNGNVYIVGYEFINGDLTSSLFEYDPAANSISIVGSLPANTWLASDLFFWNGQLYFLATDVNSTPPNYTFALLSIQIGNPLAATVVYTYSNACGAPNAVIPTGNFAGIYAGYFDTNCNGDLTEFDLASNTATFICEPDPWPLSYGSSYVPPGFPSSPCICFNDAGTVSATNTDLCPGEDFSFSDSGSNLETGDALQFILFADVTDTLGSILQISNVTTFSFDPTTMTEGATYYVAAIVGDELPNGDVDLADPCLKISDALEVIWHPLPTVSFSVANTDVCADNCYEIEAAFTGTAPFTLTYTTPAGASITETFPDNMGTFQICIAAGTPPGNWSVEATASLDRYCDCH